MAQGNLQTHTHFDFPPSPVCTDQETRNRGPRGQPIVRNVAPEQVDNPDFTEPLFPSEEQHHMVASASKCAGSTAYAHAVDIGIHKWIADTGAGLHLIPKAAVRRRNLFSKCRKILNPFIVHTANGQTECDTILECRLDMLDEGYIASHILDSTPPVISVGRLVEDCMYEFHWSHRTGPYFDTPSG